MHFDAIPRDTDDANNKLRTCSSRCYFRSKEFLCILVFFLVFFILLAILLFAMDFEYKGWTEWKIKMKWYYTLWVKKSEPPTQEMRETTSIKWNGIFSQKKCGTRRKVGKRWEKKMKEKSRKNKASEKSWKVMEITKYYSSCTFQWNVDRTNNSKTTKAKIKKER